jgi:hypothetical protein
MEKIKEGVVFIVQDTGTYNFSPAYRWGVPHVLTEDVYPSFSEQGQRQWGLKVMAELQSFDPETDFLLLTGDPIAIGRVFHMVATRFEKFRCLKWDKKAGYVPVNVNVKGDD